MMLGYINCELAKGRVIVRSTGRLFFIKTPEQDITSAYIIFTFKALFTGTPYGIVTESYLVR